MALFKPLLQLGMLFSLTAFMCLVLVDLLPVNPLCSVGFFCIGTMTVLLTVDAL